MNDVNLNEFNIYDDNFSISPDKTYVAYTVRQKPDDLHCPPSGFLDNGTFFQHVGCELWLLHIPSRKSKIISRFNSWQPSWSTDSKKIAFYSDNNGHPHVWIYSLEDDQVKQVCELVVNDSFIRYHKVCWGSENMKIYFPSIPASQCSNSTKNNMQVTIRHYTSPPDQQSTKAVSNNNNANGNTRDSADIIEFDLTTHSINTLVNNEHLSKPVCSHLGISDTGNYLYYFTKPQYCESSLYFKSSVWVYPLRNGKHPIFVSEIEISNNPVNKAPCLWVPDEDKLIYINDGILYEAELSHYREIQRAVYHKDYYYLTATYFQWAIDQKEIIISAADKSQINSLRCLLVIGRNKRICKINLDDYPNYDGIKAIMQSDSNNIIIVSRAIHTEETALLQFEVDGANDAMEVINSSYCSLGTTGSANIIPLLNHQWLSYYEGPFTSGNLYILDKLFSPVTQLTDINPDLLALPHYTIKVFQTSNITRFGKALTVNTTVLLPESIPVGAITCVYPGYCASQSAGEYGGRTMADVPNLHYLQQGFAVILPDLPWNIDANVVCPLDELTSILIPQIETVISSLNLDKNKIGIIGHSWGGYAAAGIICKTSIFNAAVASSGIYDLGAYHGFMTSDGVFYGRRFIEYEYFGMGHPPSDNTERYINSSPYYLADKISTPLLITHGSRDMATPAAEAEKLFAQLERLNKTSELVIYQDEEHCPREWKKSNYLDYLQRIINYFNHYLGVS